MSGEKISLLILYTGGTIGMMQDPQTGSLVPFDLTIFTTICLF